MSTAPTILAAGAEHTRLNSAVSSMVSALLMRVTLLHTYRRKVWQQHLPFRCSGLPRLMCSAQGLGCRAYCGVPTVCFLEYNKMYYQYACWYACTSILRLQVQSPCRVSTVFQSQFTIVFILSHRNGVMANAIWPRQCLCVSLGYIWRCLHLHFEH